jgi:hypothetical protein
MFILLHIYIVTYLHIYIVTYLHCYIFTLLHRVRCRITQALHQPLHIYKMYKILHIKTIKTLLHVSVLRPSTGSYIFLAEVTLEIVTY